MQSLNEKIFHTAFGDKKIAIHVMDILDLDEELDVMTVSSFINGYRPSLGTVIKALYDSGISVEKLSEKPKIDLRDSIHVWMSDEIKGAKLPIRHVACIEMNSLSSEIVTQKERETRILSSRRTYYRVTREARILLIMNYCLDFYDDYGIEKHDWFEVSKERVCWNSGHFFRQDIHEWPEYKMINNKGCPK